MEPILARTVPEFLKSLLLSSQQLGGGQMSVTDTLLINLLLLQKLTLASTDVGVDWDSFEVYVEAGTVSTKIVDVRVGDVVVVKLINHDVDNAQTVFYEQSAGVAPSTFYGLQFSSVTVGAANNTLDFHEFGFPPTTIGVTNDQLDFTDEDATHNVNITNGLYTTGAALAAQIETDINLVTTRTYTVTYSTVTNLFTISKTTGALLSLTLDFLGAANSIATDLGYTATDHTGANTYDSDGVVRAYLTATVTSGVYATGVLLAAAVTTALAAAGAANTYTATWNDALKKFELAAATGATSWGTSMVLAPSGNSIGGSLGYTTDSTVTATPWTITSDNQLLNSVVGGQEYSVGFPLLAGSESTVVLERPLYARLDPDATIRVPLSVRRSRVISRVGGHQ